MGLSAGSEPETADGEVDQSGPEGGIERPARDEEIACGSDQEAQHSWMADAMTSHPPTTAPIAGQMWCRLLWSNPLATG